MTSENIDWKERAEELARENHALRLEVCRYKFLCFRDNVSGDNAVHKHDKNALLNMVRSLQNENEVLHIRCDELAKKVVVSDDDEEYDFDYPDGPSAQEQYFHRNYTGCL